ncbi:MAG: cytochrome b/b6 domain-containing protein [Gammaproteobacteria bacterium]|nr:cytochrome b/b6 domain-containing protein [Gammaproteobacteria bacterium]
MAGHGQHKALIWDLPTRVFHWLLVLGFAVGWISSENDRLVYLHVYAGYVFFGLLVFRLVWGAVGSRFARFRSFAHDWPSVTAYLKGLLNGEAQRYVGHNPAGGWAIFLLIFLGLGIGITGMLVLGGEEGHGPLRHLVSYDVGSASKELHEGFATFMLLLVFVHIAGVIVESFLHKENLIWSMVTGVKNAAPELGVSRFGILAVLMLAIVFSSAAYYFRGYVQETKETPFRPYSHEKLADNATWRTECGDCHMAFHPSLLPARSWQKLMAQQSDHFGDDLALEGETLQEVTDFLLNNSADKGETEAANKMIRSISADQAPIAITETRYWKHKHSEIGDEYWKSKRVGSKSNCAACHLDANDGWYEDSNMRLPDIKP